MNSVMPVRPSGQSAVATLSSFLLEAHQTGGSANLRVSSITEMLKLERRDIDLKRNQLTVRESKSGKGRIVPLSETAAAPFRELSKVRLIDNPQVFPGEIPGEQMKDLPRYWEQ